MRHTTNWLCSKLSYFSLKHGGSCLTWFQKEKSIKYCLTENLNLKRKCKINSTSESFKLNFVLK